MKKALFLVLSIIAVIVSYAQTGSLSGQVLNESRQEMAKVKVSIVNEGGSAVALNVLTSNGGYYEIKNLPPGKYNVQFSYPGFVSQTQRGVIIIADKPTWLNCIMNPDPNYVPSAKVKTKNRRGK